MKSYVTQAWDEGGQQILTTADPQPYLESKAQHCPVQRNPDGSYTVTRMADILALNKDRRVLGNSHPNTRGVMGGDRPLIPLELDGHDHVKYRRLLDPLFTPRQIGWLEHPVRRLANELIDEFIGAGHADVYHAFCEPLPSRIFVRLMGVPEDDLNYFLSFKNRILGHGFTREARIANLPGASADCYAYFHRLLDEREQAREPGDDMIGRLLSAESEGQRLTREEMLDITFLLMIAGLDTVAASLADLLVRLAKEPDLRKRLVAQPELWPSAVEELMRFESPVHQGYRVPTEDIEIDGHVIPADTTIHVIWASANVDPEAFEDPLTLAIERDPNPHIAFASGFHRCLGSHLTRLELRTALDEFHRRIPDYHIADDAILVFDGNPRTPHELPLVWA